MLTTSSPFFARVYIFLKERIPPIPLFLQSIFFTLCLGFSYCLIESTSFEKIKTSLFLIFFGSLTLSLLVRVIDELKDEDDDKINFPNRCLPSGKVLYADVKIIGFFTLLIFITVNLLFNINYNFFFILLIYFFLFKNWFFLPNDMRKNLIIILITHNPMGFVIPFYFITLLNLSNDNLALNINHFLLSLCFWLPTLAWEVSRKIRSEEEETLYNTYSKSFGIFPSVMIPVFSLGLQLFGLYYLFNEFLKNQNWIIFGLSFYLLYSIIFILFAIKPSSKFSKWLRPMTEGYVSIINIILIINILIYL